VIPNCFYLTLRLVITYREPERKEKMMPLSMAKIGEENSIKKVGGGDEIRQFLANLGFIPGSHITIVTKNSGNVIVSIKESRVAVSQEMASKIMV
jgi:ferrous iron transport protein A